MKKVIVCFIMLFSASLIFFSSCTKDSELDREEKITLYITDTGEQFSVNSIDDAKNILLSDYSYLSNIEESINKLDALQKELSYSKSIDLDDPKVVQEYEKYLSEEYGKAEESSIGTEIESRNIEGILYDGQGTGFLALTTIYPMNLASSKRNRASSWLPIIGLNVLCDKTWWRGDKVIVQGVGGANLKDLGTLGFNNKTESYF